MGLPPQSPGQVQELPLRPPRGGELREYLQNKILKHDFEGVVAAG